MSEIFQPFYLATFSFLFFISLIIHFLFRIILKRLKVVDVPDGEKKIHRMLVPISGGISIMFSSVSYTHLRAHETGAYLVCRLLLEKKKK